MRRLLLLRRTEEDEAGHMLARLGEALRGEGWEVEERRLAGGDPAGLGEDRQDPLAGFPVDGSTPLLLLDARLLGLLFGSPARLGRSIALLSPDLFAPAPPAREAARFHLLGHLLPRLGLSLAPSRALAEEAARRFALPPSRLLLLPPGVRAPARPAPPAPHPPRILLPLFGREGVDLATPFAALARLFDLRFRLTLVLPAEDAPLAEEARHLAAAHGLPSPAIVTGLDESPLEADLLLLPEDRHALGVAAAWAAAGGLPVALGREAAGREFITEGAAAVFGPKDAVQLSRALRRMIADAELRAAMREAAAKGRGWPGWEERGVRLAATLTALEAWLKTTEE